MSEAKPITTRSRAFRLEYRYNDRLGRTQGGVRAKVFWHSGPLRNAVSDARRHCEIMNYTFVFCEPYIVDLEEQEALKAKYQDFDTAYFDESKILEADTKVAKP